MKGVSEFVIVLIILIIAIASILVVWLFYNSMFGSVTTEGETSSLGEVLSSCMKIDSIRNNKIYLRNCGTGTVRNDSISFYMDEAPIAFTMNPSSIGEGQVAEIDLALTDLWGISIGNYKIRISSKAGEVERYIKASLPPSCILALDFDEGSGNITYDKSGYGNNGNLSNESDTYTCGVNGACPDWVTGKFGYALNFDGIGDRVYLGTSFDPPQDGMTISLLFRWTGPKSTDGSNTGDQSFIAKANDTWDMDHVRWDLERDWEAGSHFIRFITPNDYNTSGYSLTPNIWTYIVVSQNSTNRSLYVNGNFYSASPKLIFGNDHTAHVDVGSGFNGTIDSVRVYNQALTPDQTLILTLGEYT